MRKIEVVCVGALAASVAQAQQPVNTGKSITQTVNLAYNTNSYTFGVPFTIGQPPQPAQMLVDLASPITNAFATTMNSYLTRPYKFYNKAKSVTASYLDVNNLYSTDSCGF